VTAVPALRRIFRGLRQVPLLVETTGDNFDRMVARCGEREALVDRSSHRRWTYS
jgi:fatty-acyl-CoA synthase